MMRLSSETSVLKFRGIWLNLLAETTTEWIVQHFRYAILDERNRTQMKPVHVLLKHRELRVNVLPAVTLEPSDMDLELKQPDVFGGQQAGEHRTS